jgi:hypothetical protein
MRIFISLNGLYVLTHSVHAVRRGGDGFDSTTDLAKRSVVVWARNQILVVGVLCPVTLSSGVSHPIEIDDLKSNGSSLC